MRKMRVRLTPRSLRWQFTLAVAGLALLIVAGELTVLFALRAITSSIRQFGEERLQQMQEADELVHLTLLVERESYQLSNTESYDAMHGSYANIIKHLTETDRLADSLASGEDHISVLSLRQSSQLFRNTVNVFVQLQERELRNTGERPSPESAPSAEPDTRTKWELKHEYASKLHHQVAALVAAAQLQSKRYAEDYLQSLLDLEERSARSQRWVMALLAGSLLLAWLIAQRFLGRHVLKRLEFVSRGLHRSEVTNGHVVIPVQGNDEIAEMARAVEHFQEDRWKLAQRTAEMEAANKELEELSYAMSHEMHTPLRAIDGFSQMLLERHGTELDEEGKRMLMVLRDRSRHQGRLVDDILRFLALSRHTMDYDSVDIRKLTAELFDEIQAAAPERHLRLVIGVLPLAWCDRALIRQALQCLLKNAVKFSPVSAEVLIEVGGTADEKEVIYSVRDHGVGFDMRYAHKLFRLFERIHPTGQYEGTAMGLAIVRRVIQRHGGRVWAEGREGEGATFHFSLPNKSA
jgi:two-component system, NtrC family, sensor kinase